MEDLLHIDFWILQVQRSHSDRVATRKNFTTQKSTNKNDSLNNDNNNTNNTKDMPAKAKCPKIDNTSKSDINAKPVVARKVQNKFFQQVKKCQDDAVVPPLQLKKKDAPREI